MLYYGTSFVLEDEPCLRLSELVKPSPSGQPHRYQIIKVLRDDKIHEFRDDLGLASNFKIDQFIIFGGFDYGKKGEIWHSVGYLRDLAYQVREIRWDKKEMAQNNEIRERY